MNLLYFILMLVLFPSAQGSQKAGVGSNEPFALLELFSSQGCSSCPPADRLLSGTIADSEKTGKNIIALSFHVDYWDRLGWKDPFSDRQFTERQSAYVSKLNLRSAYTPQMVVNGTMEFVGSDSRELSKALATALSTRPAVFFEQLECVKGTDDILKVNYQLKGEFGKSIINFALVSANEKTVIKRGENSGLTLFNQHVVRQFITIPASQSGQAVFRQAPSPTSENCIVIAYVQDNGTLAIKAAAQMKTLKSNQ